MRFTIYRRRENAGFATDRTIILEQLTKGTLTSSESILWATHNKLSRTYSSHPGGIAGWVEGYALIWKDGRSVQTSLGQLDRAADSDRPTARDAAGTISLIREIEA